MKHSRRLETDDEPSRSRAVQFVLVALLALAVVALWTPIVLLTALRVLAVAAIRAARRLVGQVPAKQSAMNLSS